MKRIGKIPYHILFKSRQAGACESLDLLCSCSSKELESTPSCYTGTLVFAFFFFCPKVAPRVICGLIRYTFWMLLYGLHYKTTFRYSLAFCYWIISSPWSLIFFSILTFGARGTSFSESIKGVSHKEKRHHSKSSFQEREAYLVFYVHVLSFF